jgi:hypothetical protein
MVVDFISSKGHACCHDQNGKGCLHVYGSMTASHPEELHTLLDAFTHVLRKRFPVSFFQDPLCGVKNSRSMFGQQILFL